MTDVAAHTHESRVSSQLVYALIGFVLGVGAPIGSLLLRYAIAGAARPSLAEEIDANLFFYSYMLLGTCTVFAVAGWIAGERADRLRRLEAFYHELSELDALTGLLNAGAFRDRYERTVSRAARYGTPMALLLIDVDRLKEINDQDGHRAGNDALKHVAKAVRTAKRAADISARWGGDEFAVLLEDADGESASRVANTIVERLRAHPLTTRKGSRPVTVTIGVASGTPRNESDDFFDTADRALYRGKQEGRNRVSASPHSRS